MTQAASRLSDSFGARLALALKALNLSGAQLAAAVGVNKSLVSRWLSGQVVPTGYNLARISAVLAATKPGFNMTLWERPRAEFDLFLGLCTAVPVEALSASLEDVLAQGAAASEPAKPVSGSIGQAVRPSWKARSLAVVAVGFGLILMLAAGLAWRFWPARPLQTAPAPAEASVAVLPFVNMSGDPKKEYFSDGFSEELVNDLSNNPQLLVTSRTSSFAFKGRNQDVGFIARALRVHAIVEGSVRESGNRMRITAQLIDADSGYHLWSAVYDRNLTDILSVQEELARAIATALTHRLVPVSSSLRPKIDPAVYRLYLEGVDQFNTSRQRWPEAFATFQRVTVRAPEFADGFARLAQVAEDTHDVSTPVDYETIARDAAQRALSLDPRNARARFFRGVVEMNAWNWRAARSDFRILLKQNPNCCFSLSGLGQYYLYLGFPDEAFAVARRSWALDPKDYRDSYFTLDSLVGNGAYQEALDVARGQLVRHPRDAARLADVCGAYAGEGQIARANATYERLRSLQTDFDSEYDFQSCGWFIALATGNRVAARRILQIWELEYPDKLGWATDLAKDHILLGDFDGADEWLQRAYDRRESFAILYDFRGFGYETLIKRYRLTLGWKALTEKPLFKEWQAEHDRIAAALAAHRDPLN